MPLSGPHDPAEIQRLIRRGWEGVAAEYAKDRLGVFGRFAGRLLDLLGPQPGSTLLDVATGTGAVALRAAERVGSEGQVRGADVAMNMLSLARRAAVQQGAANVSLYQTDAERLCFPDASFDSVTCAFSLFQFPDMGRALAEMRRVLKRGGYLGLSNWGPGYFSPVAALQRDLFREFGLRPLLTNPIVFKPADLRKHLQEAGFSAIELVEDTQEVWFESPEEVWAFNLDMGPFPVMLRRQLTAVRRRELARRFAAMLEDRVTREGIACTFHPLYAVARRREAS